MSAASEKKRKPQRKLKEYSTQARREAGLAVPPLDQADVEVITAVKEGRPLDPLNAFPEPPPPIETTARKRNAKHAPLDGSTEILSEVQPGATVMTRRRGRALPVPAVEPDPPPLPEATDGPGERLRKVQNNAGPYLQEYRLRLLHRMLMRNLPLDMIAAKMEVSMQAVHTLRSELNRRLVYEAQTINRYEIAGKTMAFYDEVQGTALRMADDAAAKPYVKLQALQTALGAQADRQRFLTASGFWGAAPYVPMDATEDASSRAADKLHTLIEAIIDDKGEMQIDEVATDEHIAQADLDDRVKLL